LEHEILFASRTAVDEVVVEALHRVQVKLRIVAALSNAAEYPFELAGRQQASAEDFDEEGPSETMFFEHVHDERDAVPLARMLTPNGLGQRHRAGTTAPRAAHRRLGIDGEVHPEPIRHG